MQHSLYENIKINVDFYFGCQSWPLHFQSSRECARGGLKAQELRVFSSFFSLRQFEMFYGIKALFIYYFVFCVLARRDNRMQAELQKCSFDGNAEYLKVATTAVTVGWKCFKFEL